MPQPLTVVVEAPVATVRAILVHDLAAAGQPDGSLVVPSPNAPSDTLGVRVEAVAEAAGTRVTAGPVGRVDIPFFGWAFGPLMRRTQARAVGYVVGAVTAAVAGRPAPPLPRSVVGLPDVPFSAAQTRLLATASAAAAVVTFGSGLVGQLADPIGDSFGASDATLTTALGVTRIGALVALFVTAIADRRGRRRSILIGLLGAAIASAVSAVAPTLAILTAAQVLQRACVITTVTVAGIAAIEEAPEGARAYAASMLALAGGFGFSFAVVSLPLADLGTEGWRIPYVVSALAIVLTPAIARNLTETSRFRNIEGRADVARGNLREIFDERYRRRFLILAASGFLLSVFNAPSSQLMNKYLTDVRDFSNTGVAVFRAATTALPGLLGVLVAGRLADARGRKPVAIVGLFVSTVTTMAFFLLGGPSIWVLSAVSVLLVSIGSLAVGTMDVELFATEVRGTSNALLTVVAVGGSLLGLVLAGNLADPLGDIGRSIALCGVAAIVASLVFVPRLPESGLRSLDEISPTQSTDEYGQRDG